MRKILLLLPFFLWTCGGGGGSTEPEPPQLPTVTNIEVTTLEDTAKTFALTGSDPNNLALTYSISTQPQHGTISISGGAATYSPNANYHGQDVIAYLASSTSGNSNIGTIIITITPVDDEPNTMDVTATTDEDNSVTLTLEAEEYDGENIEFQVRNSPSNGSVDISGNTATYTPNENWNGTDQFNFEAIDSNSRNKLNVATATIVVEPVNDAPSTDDIDGLEVLLHKSLEIELSGSDVEGSELTYAINSNPSIGSVSLENNIITYTPSQEGTESFTFSVSDGELSSTGNIEITNMQGYYDISFKYNSLPTNASSIIETTSNHILIGGYFSNSTNSDTGSFLMMLDEKGEKMWEKELNQDSSVFSIQFFFIDEISDGFLVFNVEKSRLTIRKTDFDGNILWDKIHVEENLSLRFNITFKKINDNEYLIGGRTNTTEKFSYIGKLDSSGNFVWTTVFPYSTTIENNSLGGFSNEPLIDDNGNIYIELRGSNLFNIQKLDNNGNKIWLRTVDLWQDGQVGGSYNYLTKEFIFKSSDDKLYLTGYSNDGNQSFSFIEIDYEANVLNEINTSKINFGNYQSSLQDEFNNNYFTVSGTQNSPSKIVKLSSDLNEIWEFGPSGAEFNDFYISQDEIFSIQDARLFKLDLNGNILPIN